MSLGGGVRSRNNNILLLYRTEKEKVQKHQKLDNVIYAQPLTDNLIMIKITSNRRRVQSYFPFIQFAASF